MAQERVRQVLQVNVADVLNRYRDLCPAAMPSIGLVFGNFNQVPILSKAHHPEVDYKPDISSSPQRARLWYSMRQRRK